MKPTPVTRKEYFLNALGADGAISVPSPVPRIEKYLYRLDGFNDKDIPEPVTRIEKYLYYLCGEHDKGIPEPVTRIEKYLYYACGFEEYGYPTPVTREEQFWYDYIQAYIEVKTLTGTLPLTFRTSETALRSWTIYGNDFQQEESKGTRLPLSFYTDEDKVRNWTIYGNNTQHNYSAEGTLPLTFTTHTAGAASDWEIYGNDDNGTENLFDITKSDNLSAWEKNGYYFIYLSLVDLFGLTPDSYTIRLDVKGSIVSQMPIGFTTTFATGLISADRLIDTDGTILRQTLTKTLTANGDVYIVLGNPNQIPNDTVKQQMINDFIANYNITIVKGSTAPEHFIPYQQGVGERTVNEFDASDATGIEDNYYIAKTTGNKVGNAGYYISAPIPVASEERYYWVFSLSGANHTLPTVGFFDANDNQIGAASHGDGIKSFSFTTPANCAYVKASVYKNTINEAMLIKGNTAPTTYIPYGYEIPISVNNTQQTFYIGDSPLTAGQSISKTSTGVDLELFEGENTISTTLYNKPETSITYTDYIGVGEYVNGQWQIPLTVSDGTNTTTVNIPIDAPLTAYDTATKTSTGVDIPTYVGTNTISTTLENKPEMLVYYGYKGVGEHSGDTWELDFITSANGNQQLTKITMDKPLRAGETLTSEQASKAIPTYADAENTLSLYPNAAGYGNPEMTITYKGG